MGDSFDVNAARSDVGRHHDAIMAFLEALQRLVAMTAIQFVLFEPVGMVQGNDEIKDAAEKLASLLVKQLKTLKTKKFD